MVVGLGATGVDDHIALPFSELIGAAGAQQIDAGARVDSGITADVQTTISGVGKHIAVSLGQIGDAGDERCGRFLMIITQNVDAVIDLKGRGFVQYGAGRHFNVVAHLHCHQAILRDNAKRADIIVEQQRAAAKCDIRASNGARRAVDAGQRAHGGATVKS